MVLVNEGHVVMDYSIGPTRHNEILTFKSNLTLKVKVNRPPQKKKKTMGIFAPPATYHWWGCCSWRSLPTPWHRGIHRTRWSSSLSQTSPRTRAEPPSQCRCWSTFSSTHPWRSCYRQETIQLNPGCHVGVILTHCVWSSNAIDLGQHWLR